MIPLLAALGCVQPPTHRSATWIDAPLDALDGVSLVDPAGASVGAADTAGRWTAALLGFTSCPDVCPGAMRGTRAGLDALAAEGIDVDLWFVAVDPARDAAQLGAWADAFAARALTGEPAELRRFADQIGGSFAVRDDGSVDHSTALTLIDPHGRPIGWQTRPSDADAVTADLGAVIRAYRPPIVLEGAALSGPVGPIGVAAGYGALTYHGAPARWERASSPDVSGVYVHETVYEGNVASMRPTSFTLRPGDRVTLAPGGAHLMLPGARADLAEARVRLDLDGATDLWVVLPRR